MKVSNQKIKVLVQGLDLIPKERLEEAFNEAEKNHELLAKVLVEKDLISDDHLGQIISDYLGYEFVDLDRVAIDEEALNIIPEIMARKQKVAIFGRDKDKLKLAMVNPGNLEIINLIEKKTGQVVVPYYTTTENIESALVKYQKGIQKEFGEIIEKNIYWIKQILNKKLVMRPMPKIIFKIDTSIEEMDNLNRLIDKER